MRAAIHAEKAGRSWAEAGSESRPGDVPARFPRWLRIGFWLCIAISAAAVFRRVGALLERPSRTAPGRIAQPQLAQLDRWFASHAALTWVHILCALAFVALLPLLFRSRTRPAIWLERTFLSLGLIVGLTAYAMSIHAVGGWLERSAVLVFNTLFLTSLAQVFVAARRGDEARKGRWTIRAVAILLGIATTRPVMGVFFATSRITHLTPRQFFGIAFWIGFSLNTLAIELWLRRSHFAGERLSL